MKFSELWLRELVDTPLNTEDLSNQITMVGLKVDNIEPVAGTFNNVIIGEIIECNQYSHFNKFFITKINIGSNQLLDIICDAPNCRKGLKVAVATTNSVLSRDFIIKIVKLYNELSEGMLCSFSKLGIFDDYCHSNNDIIELPTNAPVGFDIREYLKLDDNTIEVSITPNRADCFSIIGIAREVAAFSKIKLNEPNIIPVPINTDDTLPVLVEAPNACPRYLCRIIKNININVPTPFWMKERLRRCGIKSINIVIDIANYILLELGQPILILDKDRINGSIVVRMAKEEETLTLLENNKIKLDSDTLVIADHNQVLAIGGILVGEYASINNTTKNILLECAFFNPLIINGRARRYGLYTNTSHRYERGVNPELQNKAIEYATSLIFNICNGNVGPILDITNESMLPKSNIITLRRNKLDSLIGYHIASVQIIEILCRLGCIVKECNGLWEVIPPSWRFDIKIEEDLIEEVTRIYGYNNIPNKPAQVNLEILSQCKTNVLLERVKDMLNDKGYQEVITYSFVNPKLQQLIHPNEKALTLSNPISKEMSVMRLSLWSGLLNTVIYNQNHQQNRVRIFETGFRFVPDTMSYLGVRQDLMLAGAICGNRYVEHWAVTKDIVDFYDMKGDLESIFDLTGKLSEIKFLTRVIPALHLGQSAAIYLRGICIGCIGVVHPSLEKKLGLKSRTVIFELEWNKIENYIIPQVQEISNFPINRRDIAIVVSKNIPVADILSECKKVGENQIVGVNLFDVYHGSEVKKGYKNLAISLIIQNPSRTLKEEEIAAIVAKCAKALEERFQASLRC